MLELWNSLLKMILPIDMVVVLLAQDLVAQAHNQVEAYNQVGAHNQVDRQR